jgi:hypothetical protein
MKKPGLTGLKMGIDFGAYVVDLVSIRSGGAVRNHFKHGVERLDGDAGGKIQALGP